jgi:hypothetical protein
MKTCCESKAAGDPYTFGGELLNGLTSHVGKMDNLGAIDYLLDNTPGISDDISLGIKKLFGG